MFEYHLDILKVGKVARSKLFPVYMIEATQRWFRRYKFSELYSWTQLSVYFGRQFNAGRKVWSDPNIPSYINQCDSESLPNFIKWFKFEAMRISVTNDDGSEFQIKKILCFWEKNGRNPCKSMKEIYERAGGYIRVEEARGGKGIPTEKTAHFKIKKKGGKQQSTCKMKKRVQHHKSHSPKSCTRIDF